MVTIFFFFVGFMFVFLGGLMVVGGWMIIVRCGGVLVLFIWFILFGDSVGDGFEVFMI